MTTNPATKADDPKPAKDKARFNRPTDPTASDATHRKPGPFTPPKGKRESCPPKKNPSAEPARIDAAGLIQIENKEAVESLPIHYYAERSKWYGPNGQSGYSLLSASQAASLVAEHGFNRSFKGPQGNTVADRVMLWLVQNRPVAYAGPLAGYPAGCHVTERGRVLVTESPRLIEPKPGKWPIIRRLLETLLEDEKEPQLDVLYTWLSMSYRAYWERMTSPGPWAFRHCPALAIFGPKGCGKTALLDLILTPLFGGRKGDPMNFLKEGRFNKDLFAASLLAMDDKGASANLAERRQRGEAIKDLIWKPEQRMEGKGVDALMLRPFWRLVIAGNDDDSGLQVCPALSPSLEDKLIILKASVADGLPTTHEENDAWASAIHAELPAFAMFLVGYQPPEKLRLDTRSRVANFWHPELASALREMQPEMRLLELIDSLDLLNDCSQWVGSASEFERALRGKDHSGMLDRVFTTGQSAGRMLAELARVVPDRVEKRNHSGISHYRIFPAKEKRAGAD